jgi:hypothetical protein
MANKFALSTIATLFAVWQLLVNYQNWVLTQNSSLYSRKVHNGLVEFISSTKHGVRNPANGNGFFIVGMHRSGTSVLAGTLNIMGYSAGNGKLKGATDYNPKGYFEMESLIIQNQDWLIEQDVAWGVGRGEFDPSLAKINATGRDTLRNIDVSEPWMLKDPRLCLTLPAWDRGFAHPPPAVFTYRHPLSVALSTCQRSQTELFYGLRSWLFHNMNAIQNLKGRCVVRTSHKAMMLHPLNETLRISDELTNRCGIWKPALESEDEEHSTISDFVSHSLHHNQEVMQNGVDRPTLRRMFRDCSFPRDERVSDLNMKMFNFTMRTYADIESGKAFNDGYEWPELFQYRGSPKTRDMKIYKETSSTAG